MDSSTSAGRRYSRLSKLTPPAMTRWTLYTGTGTCALATHIALNEAGAAFDLVHLDFNAAQQQSAAYLAVNPKGRVPALATESGVLTETPALLAFVAQR